MPVIHVQMLVGRSAEQKRQLIVEFTRVMEDVLGVSRERVNVIIEDVPAENWGRGGSPLAEESRRGSETDARIS